MDTCEVNLSGALAVALMILKLFYLCISLNYFSGIHLVKTYYWLRYSILTSYTLNTGGATNITSSKATIS